MEFNIRSDLRHANSSSSIIVSSLDNNCIREFNDSGCDSNYLALNVNNYGKSEPILEFGTKSLVLDLLTSSFQNSIKSNNKKIKPFSSNPAQMKSNKQVITGDRKKLLEMNGRMQSITLARENLLSSSLPTSASLTVGNMAKSPHIIGSFDENLE